MNEQWRNIKGFEGLYQVSNLGNVKSLKRFNRTSKIYSSLGYYRKEKILKPSKDAAGYLKIDLCKNGKRKNYLIHRLVAETFIPNPENKLQVNHKDGNKSNNFVDNLEWATPKENIIHAVVNGLNIPKKGWKHHSSKAVLQYDMNNNFIKRWGSIIDANKALNISETSISYCCNNKQRKAGKYRWKFEIKESKNEN